MLFVTVQVVESIFPKLQSACTTTNHGLHARLRGDLHKYNRKLDKSSEFSMVLQWKLNTPPHLRELVNKQPRSKERRKPDNGVKFGMQDRYSSPGVPNPHQKACNEQKLLKPPSGAKSK